MSSSFRSVVEFDLQLLEIIVASNLSEFDIPLAAPQNSASLKIGFIKHLLRLMFSR